MSNPLCRLLYQVSVQSILDGRFHTVLTAAFSHVQFYHLLANMFGLYFFGSEVMTVIDG